MLQEEKTDSSEEESSSTFKILSNITFIIIIFSICGFTGCLLGLSVNIAQMNNHDNCTIIDKHIVYYPNKVEIDLLIVYNPNRGPLWIKKNYTHVPNKDYMVGESYKCYVNNGSITWNVSENYQGRIIMFAIFLVLFSTLCCSCLILDLIFIVRHYKKNLLLSHLNKQKQYSEFDKDF